MSDVSTPYRVIVPAPGDASVLQVEQFEPPAPSEGEVLVQVRAAGVNFIDTYLRSGIYKASYPHTPGSEGSGIVVDVGDNAVSADGTTHLQNGDRVMWHAAPGSYGSHVVVPAINAVRVPENVETTLAAAIPLQGLTAHYLAMDSYAIKANDVVLVHAGAGGVGLLLTQIAKLRGAHVITTVSNVHKEELSRGAGADDVVRYDKLADLNAELPAIVKEISTKLRALGPIPGEPIAPNGQNVNLQITDRGPGADVVYDGVGLSTFEASIASLRTRGTLVLFGGASGQVPPFDLQRLNALGSLSVTRPSLGHFVLTPRELFSRYTDLLTWISNRDLNFHVGQTFTLSQVAQAHQSLETRHTTGKVLLLP